MAVSFDNYGTIAYDASDFYNIGRPATYVNSVEGSDPGIDTIVFNYVAESQVAASAASAADSTRALPSSSAGTGLRQSWVIFARSTGGTPISAQLCINGIPVGTTKTFSSSAWTHVELDAYVPTAQAQDATIRVWGGSAHLGRLIRYVRPVSYDLEPLLSPAAVFTVPVADSAARTGFALEDGCLTEGIWDEAARIPGPAAGELYAVAATSRNRAIGPNYSGHPSPFADEFWKGEVLQSGSAAPTTNYVTWLASAYWAEGIAFPLVTIRSVGTTLTLTNKRLLRVEGTDAVLLRVDVAWVTKGVEAAVATITPQDPAFLPTPEGAPSYFHTLTWAHPEPSLIDHYKIGIAATIGGTVLAPPQTVTSPAVVSPALYPEIPPAADFYIYIYSYYFDGSWTITPVAVEAGGGATHFRGFA